MPQVLAAGDGDARVQQPGVEPARVGPHPARPLALEPGDVRRQAGPGQPLHLGRPAGRVEHGHLDPVAGGSDGDIHPATVVRRADTTAPRARGSGREGVRRLVERRDHLDLRGRGARRAGQRAVGLQDQLAGAPEVGAQVVVQHGGDRPAAQQGRVVAVQVVGDEGRGRPAGLPEGVEGRGVAAADGVDGAEVGVQRPGPGRPRRTSTRRARRSPRPRRTVRSGASVRIAERNPLSRSSSPRKLLLLSVTSTGADGSGDMWATR